MPETMSPQVAKSFDFAADATKQVITLSTAILTVTATFADKIFTESKLVSQIFCGITWILLIVSIVSGIWTLLQLTTGLAQPPPGAPPSILRSRITNAAMVQHVSFILALSVLAGYGLYSLARAAA